MKALETAQLIVRLAKAGLTGVPADKAVRPELEDRDWDEIYEISRSHGLAPLVQAGLQVCKITPPAQTASRFVQYSRAYQLRAARGGDQLREIEAALAEKRIGLIVLKGMMFAYRYYPTPGLRRFGDIDILVRKPDIDRAGAALQKLGYRRLDGDTAEPPSAYFDHPYKYHAAYERDGGFPVELHWDLVPKSSPVAFDLTSIFERSKERDGWISQELGLEDEIIFQAVHMARHEFVVPARAYFDLYLLLDKNPPLDPASLWHEGEARGAVMELSIALWVAAEWGLINIEPALRDRAAKTISDAGLHPRQLARYTLTWPKFEYADRAIDIMVGSSPTGTLRGLADLFFPRYQALIERETKVGAGVAQPAHSSYSALWRSRISHWARKSKNLPAEIENLLMSVRMRRIFNNRTVRGDGP